MPRPILLEVCVETLDHAIAAERGGADRIELCSDLSCGGITPDIDLMRAARQHLRIPIQVLIRPRAGNFCYAPQEIGTMQRDIDVAKGLGLDGIVIGVLDPLQQINREITRDLVQSAHPLPVTFHRAIDQCPDLTEALEAVIETGAKRILTSGGKARAIDGLIGLANLISAAKNRIVIMPCGGIRGDNIERILQNTGATEIHTSLDGAGSNTTAGGDMKTGTAQSRELFEQRVREFKSALEKATLHPHSPD